MVAVAFVAVVEAVLLLEAGKMHFDRSKRLAKSSRLFKLDGIFFRSDKERLESVISWWGQKEWY